MRICNSTWRAGQISGRSDGEFFLSETIKYLYLTFDEENYLNNDGESRYLFTTEGHFYPIKQAYDSKLKAQMSIKNASFRDESNMDDDNSRLNIENKKMTTKNYYKMRFNLPMKIKYFDQLFDLVGVDDNVSELLVRKFF